MADRYHSRSPEHRLSTSSCSQTRGTCRWPSMAQSCARYSSQQTSTSQHPLTQLHGLVDRERCCPDTHNHGPSSVSAQRLSVLVAMETGHWERGRRSTTECWSSVGVLTQGYPGGGCWNLWMPCTGAASVAR